MPFLNRDSGMIILYGDGRPRKELVFDANITSEHRRSAEITSSPIETGGEVTDHRVKTPLAYGFDALFLDEKAEPLVAHQRAQFGLGTPPESLPVNLQVDLSQAISQYDELLFLHESNQVFSVFTDLEIMPEAMLESLESVLLGHGAGIRVSGIIREVQFARTELADIQAPTEEHRTSRKKRNKGDQSGKKVKAESTKSKGLLLSVGEFLVQ